MIRRIVKTLGACILVMLLVCSCTDKNKNSAMNYVDPNGNTTASASQGLMSLWIGVQKDSSADYLAFVESEEDGWNIVLDEEKGKTFSELFRTDCTLSLRNLLAVEYLHDYVFGFEFSDEQQKSVEEKIDTVAKSFGSMSAFEQEMEKYGATVSDYERYLVLMLKQTTLFNTFYNEGGMRVINEQSKQQMFRDKYAIAYHIFFDMRGTVKDDGTVVSLTQEEKQAKTAFANEVYEKIKKGEIPFENALLQYTEDAYASKYSSGYFITDDGKYFKEFTDGVFSLSAGEITMVQSQAGFHIIKRYPMDEALYDADEDVYAAITEKLITEDFSGLISSVSDGVVFNDDIIGQLDAALIKPFAGF